MATQTPNFNFDLRESADIFNPLSTNANFESLDTILKNLQETGGITTYTTTAAANLLKLSGTPKANDTVFKFVAAGDAKTWTAATGGVVNNIVALDGKQVTIKGGNMYVAWVNSANAMVVVAWPAVVDAQTFDGKGPTEWASKAQLDTVNQTAANATQTAQAAQTVANNALATAQAAGMKVTKVWTNPNPENSMLANTTINFTTVVENAKLFAICMRADANQADRDEDIYGLAFILADVTRKQSAACGIFVAPDTSSSFISWAARVVTVRPNKASLFVNSVGSDVGTSVNTGTKYAVPVEIYALS